MLTKNCFCRFKKFSIAFSAKQVPLTQQQGDECRTDDNETRRDVECGVRNATMAADGTEERGRDFVRYLAAPLASSQEDAERELGTLEEKETLRVRESPRHLHYGGDNRRDRV